MLLVDDNEDIRALIRMTLDIEGGFEVVGEAATAAGAAVAANELRPDVVVLDLALDGPASTDVIKAITRDVPAAVVVVFSGSVDQRDQADAIDAGASNFLLKGDMTELLELLCSLRDR